MVFEASHRGFIAVALLSWATPKSTRSHIQLLGRVVSDSKALELWIVLNPANAHI